MGKIKSEITSSDVIRFFLEVFQTNNPNFFSIEFQEKYIEEEIGMLISKDSHPTESLIYIAGCILKIFTSEGSSYSPEVLYSKVKSMFNVDITFSQYCLALDFLFLINKVQNKGGNLIYVY